jgi:hypothetical protein
MSQRWIKFNGFPPTQVSTENCSNIDDFLVACKERLSPLLDNFSIIQLSLSTSDHTLKRSATIPEQNSEETPFILSTINSPGIFFI